LLIFLENKPLWLRPLQLANTVYHMRYCALIILIFFTACDGNSKRISAEREAKLKPVIEYVESYLKEHQRLPAENDLYTKFGPGIVIRDRSYKYAVKNGAKTDTDYMVGAWRADWYHYYKSWDKTFLNGSDEDLFNP
jgi:hypothetical protein